MYRGYAWRSDIQERVSHDKTPAVYGSVTVLYAGSLVSTLRKNQGSATIRRIRPFEGERAATPFFTGIAIYAGIYRCRFRHLVFRNV